MCEGDDKDTQHIYAYKEYYQKFYMISICTYTQDTNIKITAGRVSGQ